MFVKDGGEGVAGGGVGEDVAVEASDGLGGGVAGEGVLGGGVADGEGALADAAVGGAVAAVAGGHGARGGSAEAVVVG